MTAKKNAKKTSSGAMKTANRIKPDAAPDTVKDTDQPTYMLLHPRELDFSAPSWVKTVFLAFLFFLLFQFAWTGAGKIYSIYLQFRQFQEFRQWEDRTIPIPLPDGEGIRKYIRKNFPQTIPTKERESAAQVFADAADAVDSGELINRDDVLGYLGANLRPVCRDPAWIAFLSGVWTEVDAGEDASPETISGTLREVSAALSEARAFIVEAVEDLEPETAKETQSEESKASSQDCPTGTCPANRSYSPYYGGYRWW